MKYLDIKDMFCTFSWSRGRFVYKAIFNRLVFKAQGKKHRVKEWPPYKLRGE